MAETTSGLALVSEYAARLKRRLWIPVVTTAIGSLIAVAVAYVLPSQYVSTARILVESQQIPSELAKSTVTASAAERLELIKQRLLTRQNIVDIIEQHDVYEGQTSMTLAQKIARIRDNTVFQTIDLGAGRRRRGNVEVAAFTISFTAHQPVLAGTIANELVTRVLEQNLQARSERAAETLAFFDREVERLAAELLAIESEIIAYKREHAEDLPDNEVFRRSRLQALQQQKFQREERRLLLEAQRRALEARIEQGAAAVAESALSPEERNLRNLRSTLVQRRAVLAASHPEIRALEARIAALEAELLPLSEAAAAEAEAAGDSGTDLQRVELRRQIAEIGRQIEQMEAQNAAEDEEATELRGSLGRTPQVEMALTALERQHTELKQRYSEAAQKRSEAATGERLESNRQAERFEVIEQAQVPNAPVSPNRKLIAAAGAGAAMMVGAAIAVLLELLNTSIRSAADLERRLQLRPAVVIPYIRTRSEIRAARLRFLAVLLLGFLAISGGLYAVDTYYAPLEVLTDRFLRETGLERLIGIINARLL